MTTTTVLTGSSAATAADPLLAGGAPRTGRRAGTDPAAFDAALEVAHRHADDRAHGRPDEPDATGAAHREGAPARTQAHRTDPGGPRGTATRAHGTQDDGPAVDDATTAAEDVVDVHDVHDVDDPAATEDAPAPDDQPTAGEPVGAIATIAPTTPLPVTPTTTPAAPSLPLAGAVEPTDATTPASENPTATTPAAANATDAVANADASEDGSGPATPAAADATDAVENADAALTTDGPARDGAPAADAPEPPEAATQPDGDVGAVVRTGRSGGGAGRTPASDLVLQALGDEHPAAAALAARGPERDVPSAPGATPATAEPASVTPVAASGASASAPGSTSSTVAGARSAPGAGAPTGEPDRALPVAPLRSMTLDLSDDELGDLRVMVTANRGAVDVAMTAERQHVHDALAHRGEDLRRELASGGVRLGSYDVGRDTAGHPDGTRQGLGRDGAPRSPVATTATATTGAATSTTAATSTHRAADDRLDVRL